MELIKDIYLFFTVASYIFIINEILKLIIKMVGRFKFKDNKVKFEQTLIEKIIIWISLTIIISYYLIFKFMSCTINDIITPLDGFLMSMKRDVKKGWYSLEIGIPKNWIIKETSLIKIKKVVESDDGILYEIIPKDEDIIIDDLYEFVQLVVETNMEIEKKELEFKESINQVKKDLEEKAKKFYEELDKMREKSFSKFDVSNSDEIEDDEVKEEPQPKPHKKRGRKPKTVKLPDSDE